MAKDLEKLGSTVEASPKKEIERQIAYLKASDYEKQNPKKFASRMVELEAKLKKL